MVFPRSFFKRFSHCRFSLPCHCSRHNHHKIDSKTVNSARRYNLKNVDLELEFAHHDPNTARINNGSFGSCPASVFAAQHQWQLKYLKQPDDFVLNHLHPSILHTQTIIKNLVNANHVDQISIVDNATTATAIILQQIAWSFHESRFNKGDAALILPHSYPAVKKSLHAYFTHAGGQVIEVNIPFPVKSDQHIITEFQEALQYCKSNGTKVRLAIIDHITSMPSMIIPVKELVKLCRTEGVDQIFVDGAHAIGSLQVDVTDIDADYYTSNFHKWFFCPPSAAFLYSKNPVNLHHPVISHNYEKGLAAECCWTGTRDYNAQLVIPDALNFINRFEGGIEEIRKSNHEKVIEMGEMLVTSWRTNLGSPPEMCACMIMVGFPSCLGITSEADAFKLRKHLRDCFGVEVHVYYREPTGEDKNVDLITGYARISHQVYNKIEDYYKFRDAVNELVNTGFTCHSLYT